MPSDKSVVEPCEFCGSTNDPCGSVEPVVGFICVRQRGHDGLCVACAESPNGDPFHNVARWKIGAKERVIN